MRGQGWEAAAETGTVCLGGACTRVSVLRAGVLFASMHLSSSSCTAPDRPVSMFWCMHVILHLTMLAPLYPTLLPAGVELVGFNLNLWSGIQLLHFLLVKEHNAVCDMLKSNHPDW